MHKLKKTEQITETERSAKNLQIFLALNAMMVFLMIALSSIARAELQSESEAQRLSKTMAALDSVRCTIKKEFIVESNSASCAGEEFSKNSCIERTWDSCSDLDTGAETEVLQASIHLSCTSTLHSCN